MPDTFFNHVLNQRNYYAKILEAARQQGFLDGYYYDDDDECWVREEK